jgi:signal transduction histidine kinase
MITRSVEAGRRLQQLLDDMLDVQRIEAGALEPELEPVQLDVLVRRSVGSMGETGSRVALELEPVQAVVEPAKVDRIVVNLVRNAVEHTPEGSATWVRLTAAGSDAVLAVEDDGPGIRETVRDGLFDAFRRDGDGLGNGVGLGLHLVRRFTDLHDGEVEVGERPGGGARFVVRLPLAGPRRAGPGRSPAGGPDLQRREQ